MPSCRHSGQESKTARKRIGDYNRATESLCARDAQSVEEHGGGRIRLGRTKGCIGGGLSPNLYVVLAWTL